MGLLEWLLDQPAAARIETLLQQAEQGNDLQLVMSWVNGGEVYYLASRKLDVTDSDAACPRRESEKRYQLAACV